jgi:uncharacterized protein (TIGR02453 family)
MTSIPRSTLDFLSALRQNNNREWFNEHKARYRTEHQHMIDFAETLRDRLSHHDKLEPMTGKQILFRIYRDIRFSKDKRPYKTHFAGHLKRATKWLRGGYYFHISPGESMVGGGFWGPEKEDLLRIRQELAADAGPLRRIIADPEFRETFGELQGDTVKTAPKGFSRDHPNIDLIRHKQYVVRHDFTDAVVTSPGFMDQLVESFRRMRPFFDYMSEVLTTDANGQPIV